MAHGLSKSRLMGFRQCPKRLWLELHRREAGRWPASSRIALANGNRVGEVARDLFPGGVLVDGEHGMDAALRRTTELLSGGATGPLFEATFEHDGVLVRTDLLLPAAGGFELGEVKSSTRLREHHLDDVAIQLGVARAAGVEVGRARLWHVDAAWVYPGDGDYRGLLVAREVTGEAEARTAALAQWIEEARAVAAGPEPEVAMGEQCVTPSVCPFTEYCRARAGAAAPYPVDLLPGRKGKREAARLAAEGFADLRDVPPGRLSDPELAMIHEATRTGAPHLDRAAGVALAALGWPRSYLDFETIGFGVPVWPGTRPYQQVPFQWSCHVESEDGALRHVEFLDLTGDEPTRACARALVSGVPEQGPVLAYSAGFERRVVLDLAQRCPDLAEPLGRIASRIVDLLPLVRAHYYHRDMRGSRSIKAVLPTIGAGASYAELGEVQEGSAAQLAYMEAIAPGTGPPRRADLREALARYCATDTLAMVELARFLLRAAR